MFTISSIIGDYAIQEKRYISNTRYIAWYTLACFIRLVEVCLLLTLIVASIWLVSLAF